MPETKVSICKECLSFMIMSYVEENSGNVTQRMVCLESSIVFVCTRINPISRDGDGFPLVTRCNKHKPMLVSEY